MVQNNRGCTLNFTISTCEFFCWQNCTIFPKHSLIKNMSQRSSESSSCNHTTSWDFAEYFRKCQCYGTNVNLSVSPALGKIYPQKWVSGTFTHWKSPLLEKISYIWYHCKNETQYKWNNPEKCNSTFTNPFDFIGLTHQKLVKIYVIKLLYSNVTREPSKLQSTTIRQNEALVKPIKNLASKHQMIFKTPQKRPPNPPTSSKKKSGNSLGFVLVP